MVDAFSNWIAYMCDLKAILFNQLTPSNLQTENITIREITPSFITPIVQLENRIKIILIRDSPNFNLVCNYFLLVFRSQKNITGPAKNFALSEMTDYLGTSAKTI